MKTIDDIKTDFEKEFSSIANKFEIICLKIREAKDSDTKYVWHPGVYVWWHPDNGVVKVGRHLTNSRKRALEHISANTGNKMQKIAEDAYTKILLFNVKDQADYHWVAALEIYFENVLKPMIPSDRQG